MFGLVGIAELLIIALIIGALFLGRSFPRKIARIGRSLLKAKKEFSTIKKIFKL